MLVHLVFWHETFVATIEAGVAVPELIERFREAQARLAALAARAAGRRLAIPVKPGSRPRTLEQLLGEIEAHIRNHHRRQGTFTRVRHRARHRGVVLDFLLPPGG